MMKIEISGIPQYHCDECRCITDEHGVGNHLWRCSKEPTHGHDATVASLRAENARLDAALADTAAQLVEATERAQEAERELSEARSWWAALKKYAYAAMEMQDLLAKEESGIYINGANSDPAQMRKVVGISQRMWSARREIEAAKD